MSKQSQSAAKIEPSVPTVTNTTVTLLWVVVLLTALTAAAFAPVLLSPHWGLYSDPHQIIQNCSAFYASSRVRWDLVHGFYRPGFHILDLGLWLISKNHPIGYYMFRFLFVATTVVATFFSSRLLTRWVSISVLSAASWLFLTPTFEVIYTLDKAETYIACFFSLATLCYLTGVSRILARTQNLATLIVLAFLVFVCAIYPMFTKETGQLLVLFGLILPICAWASIRFSATDFLEESLKKMRQRKLFQWAWLNGSLCVIAFSIYKTYFILNGGLTARYGGLSLDLHFMLTQLGNYLSTVPDFFALLAFCSVGVIFLLCKQLRLSLEQSHDFAIASSFTALGAAGALALLSWKSVIVYSWYPLFALLLPAASYFLKAIVGENRARRKIAIACVVVAMALVVPDRLVQAQLQFQLDETVKELTHHIATTSRQRSVKCSYGLPFIQPEFAEAVEELESLTLNELQPGYIEQKRDSDHLPPVQFFNFVDYSIPDGVIVPERTLKLTESHNQRLTLTPSNNFVDEPGVFKYSYWADNGTGQNWTVDNLREGDVLLVPEGDVPPYIASYRGAGMFCTDWKTKVAFLPQVEFQPIFKIERKIMRLGGHRFKFGWVALSIKAIPRISWFVDRSGNLREGAEIFAGPNLGGHSLILTVGMSKGMVICSRNHGKDIPLTAHAVLPPLIEISIPIPKNIEGRYHATTLHFESLRPGDSPGFVHVERVRVD